MRNILSVTIILLMSFTACKKNETVNNGPTAILVITPESGTTMDLYRLDGSQSHDAEDDSTKLMFRWNIEDHGGWSEWYGQGVIPHYFFEALGDYLVQMEVKDTDGNVSVTDKTIAVNPSDGLPCPGIEEVVYEGETYPTVQIGEQCWMKKNLNVGNALAVDEAASDNGVIEKHCFYDDPLLCEKFGGLYSWDEMMQYATDPGSRGICPEGWHVPTHEDWKILEGFVDVSNDANSPSWDATGMRGYNAGINLKSPDYWAVPGTNACGFEALPTGNWSENQYAGQLTNTGLWTSTLDTESFLNYALVRTLGVTEGGTGNYLTERIGVGYSVRCLRDD